MHGTLIDRTETLVLDAPLHRPHPFACTGTTAHPRLVLPACTAGGVTGVGESAVPDGPWLGVELDPGAVRAFARK